MRAKLKRDFGNDRLSLLRQCVDDGAINQINDLTQENNALRAEAKQLREKGGRLVEWIERLETYPHEEGCDVSDGSSESLGCCIDKIANRLREIIGEVCDG